jgi:hypothetical protein
VIIETLATSRASSLAVPALYKALIESRPAWKQKRSEREWKEVLCRVLAAGEAAPASASSAVKAKAGCGVFAKVDSSGVKDSTSDHMNMNAQWFYVPERDPDQERAGLIRKMVGRPSKRSETKKFKQYYWEPVHVGNGRGRHGGSGMEEEED